MRRFLIKLFPALAVILVISITSGAQTYRARVVDAETGKGLAFANIGIPETQIGTNSDEDGNFDLSIPPADARGTIYMSLIGYDELKMPVTEFISKTGNTVQTFRIRKKNFGLPEVVVKPTKLTSARLGNYILCKNGDARLQMPYVIPEKRKRNGDLKRASDTLTEMGVLMKVKGKTTFLDSISINVGQCTYPQILYRVNIYEIVDDEMKNVLHEPIYIRKSAAEVGNLIRLDLRDRNIVMHHNFVVSIERVKDLGVGEFGICFSFIGSPAYLRIASHQSRFIKFPGFALGIASYVTFSEAL